MNWFWLKPVKKAPEVRVFFSPKGDITVLELARILRGTVFRYTGDSTEFCSDWPAELRRHFAIEVS